MRRVDLRKHPFRILVSYRNGYNCSSAHTRCSPRMATIQYISSPDELSSMITSNANVVLYSYSPLCYLCIRTTPIFKSVVAQFASAQWHFCRVNITEHTDIAKLVRTTKTPHFVIFYDGKQVSEKKGQVTKDELKEWLTGRVLLREIPVTITNDSDSSSVISDRSAGSASEDIHIYVPPHPPRDYDGGISRKPCTGEFEIKPKRKGIFRWPHNRIQFRDQEPHCEYVPRETDPGLEIGRANDGESFVALMFLNTLDGSPGTLHFKFSFIPDPFEDARFKSASFTVMFSGECTDGTSFPLSILDTVPPCRPAGTIHQNSPYGPIAVVSEIQSQGSCPTVRWSLIEQCPGNGLNTNYELSVSLSAIPARLNMTYYTEATLTKDLPIFLGFSTDLKIGSMEMPYERTIVYGEADNAGTGLG